MLHFSEVISQNEWKKIWKTKVVKHRCSAQEEGNPEPMAQEGEPQDDMMAADRVMAVGKLFCKMKL